MTRREFVRIAETGVLAAAAPTRPLVVPVHRVTDSRAQCTPEQFRHFWWSIWPEAVRDFQRCGIEFQTTDTTGEIKRSPADRPVFKGLERGVLNLVLTDQIPMAWDTGRGLAGVTTRYEGYQLCVVALNHAHGHQIPLLSVNTCVHEFLHALLQDIFEGRPRGFAGYSREFRIDSYATWLWLFHDGRAIRRSAEVYLRRLRPKVL